MWFMFVIPFVIFFVVFLMIAINMFRGHHKNIDTMQTMIEDVARKNIEVHSHNIEQKYEKMCEYCGSKIASGENRCGSCGAGIKTKK